MPKLRDLDVTEVSFVGRAAMRDPDAPDQPLRFMLWKADSAPANDDPDDDPGQLAQSLDQVLDEAMAEHGQGNDDQAWQLVTAAAATVDNLLEAMNLPDADEADEVSKADWDTAYVNSLPDSAFLYVAPGGEKDAEGKTVPRDLRYFPVRDDAGKVDLPHLRNALSRIPQASLSVDVKASCQAKAQKLASAQGVGATQKQEDPSMPEEKPDNTDVTKDQGDLLAGAIASLKKGKDGLTAEHRKALRELAGAEAKDEKPADAVNKAELPEPVRLALEKAEREAAETRTRLEKAEAELLAGREREALAKAEEFVGAAASHTPGDKAALTKAVVALRKADPEQAAILEQALTGANALAKDSALFKSLGSAGAAPANGSAQAQVEARARELVTKAEGTERELTIEQARTAVLDKDPELFNRVLQEEQGQ